MYKLQKNDIKYAIQNNEPIEEKLNVIIVISNPCLYATRYKLLNEFVRRIKDEEENVNLFIVEMIYGKQKYIITDKKKKNHLQIHCETPIWHKENMINLGVKYLLPENYKAFACENAHCFSNFFLILEDKFLYCYHNKVQYTHHNTLY